MLRVSNSNDMQNLLGASINRSEFNTLKNNLLIKNQFVNCGGDNLGEGGINLILLAIERREIITAARCSGEVRDFIPMV